MMRLLLFLLLLCALLPAHADKAALNVALIKAIDCNNLTRARSLIMRGADINARNNIGQTLLERASQYGSYKYAKVLIKLGADVNSTSNYGGPLVMAATGGYVAVCRLLLEHGADPNLSSGYTPLLAVMDGSLHDRQETATLADPRLRPQNIEMAIITVMPNTRAYRARAKKMMIRQQEETNKIRAALLRKAKLEAKLPSRAGKAMLILNLLLKFGADVNLTSKDGTSPLMAATRAGSIEAVQLLLSHGARSDAQTTDHQTLLMFASASAKLSLLYLECGNNVNARDDRGYTALITATLGQHPDVVKLLVEHGADVNAQNMFGHTPLTNAETWLDLVSVEYLLNHGADTSTRDMHGNTPLKLAREYKNPALVSLLIKAGAKE